MPAPFASRARRFFALLPLCLVFALSARAGQPSAADSSRADRAALDELQRSALHYMWMDADPDSGLAYEASFAFPDGRPLVVGGTGFGIAAIVAGVDRGWLDRTRAVERLLTISRFLLDRTPRAELHGAFPHWLHKDTGKVVAFGELDDGADIVETALLMQGLLIARAYFSGGDDAEEELRRLITLLWEDVEWDWFAGGGEDGLYWHWSPNHGFSMGMKVQGFNECLIAYILGMASPTHPISRPVYDYWTAGDGYRPRTVHGYELEAALPGAGPLFFTHYSFIGLNPWEMADEHVPGGYYVRNVRHVLGNRGYCLYEAPRENMYSPRFWGLSASLVPGGYAASYPGNDAGTVAPTAALASFPYAPHYAFEVLDNLRGDFRRRAWGRNGPFDALNLRRWWFAGEYLAIDQLPIVCMVENYRSGLLWRLFMSIPEIAVGLEAAGISQPAQRPGFPEVIVTLRLENGVYMPDAHDLRAHPDSGTYRLPYWSETASPVRFLLVENEDGGALWTRVEASRTGRNWLEFHPDICRRKAGLTLVMQTGDEEYRLPLRLH